MTTLHSYLTLTWNSATTKTASDIITGIQGVFMAPSDVTIVEENPFTTPVLSGRTTASGLESSISLMETAANAGDYVKAYDLLDKAASQLEIVRRDLSLKRAGKR